MKHVHLIVLQHGYHGTSKDFDHLHQLLQHATSFSASALPSVQSPDAGWSTTSIASPTTNGTGGSPVHSSPDLSVTDAIAFPSAQASVDTVVLNVETNGGWKTDNGVLKCSERLVEAVMKKVRDVVTRPDTSATATATATSTAASPEDGVSSPDGADLTLHVSFVAHSMGGLIVRAALPSLAEALDTFAATTAATSSSSCSVPPSTACSPPETPTRCVRVIWENFCCVSVPHVGVTHMPSSFRASMGKLAGHVFSSGLHDLFLASRVVLEDITTDAHLRAWSRFNRRVLLNTANDRTVMSYSSIFAILPDEQTILFSQHKGAQPAAHANPSSAASARGTAHTSTDTVVSGGPPAHPLVAAVSLPVIRDLDALPPHATSLDELVQGGWLLDAVTNSLWPEQLLPRERELAKRIVRQVGPFEIHTVDFQPRYAALVTQTTLPGAATTLADVLPEVAAEPSREKALMAIARRGTVHWAHRALIGKGEYGELPTLFGFLDEFIASAVLGAALEKTTAATQKEAHRASQSDATLASTATA